MAVMLLFWCLAVQFGTFHATDSPIVGILTLPCDATPKNCEDDKKATTFLPASYVKWLESGGARVVPILADDSFESVQSLIQELNGVLITGGSAEFNSKSIWWNQLNNILDALRQFLNNHLSPFEAVPLWGTCLGFEGIQAATAETTKVVVGRQSEDHSLSIDFTENAIDSRLFSSWTDPNYSSLVYNKLKSENLTYNHHQLGVAPSSYATNSKYWKLTGNFTVLGTNFDENGEAFVSLIESAEETKLYWYGSQFHPEKASYVFDAHQGNNAIAHSEDAVFCMNYLAEFFVNEARIRNENKMSENDYKERVIYNDVPYFVEKGEGSYEQVYLFQKP